MHNLFARCNPRVIDRIIIWYYWSLFKLYNCRFKNTSDLSGKGNLGCNYIIYDNKQNMFICSGMAEVALLRRWKEHLAGIMLSTHVTQASKFYTAYPNNTCHKNNLRKDDLRLGLFQQLEQLVGIGFDRKHLKDIVDLFECSEAEDKELDILSGTRNCQSINEKRSGISVTCARWDIH